jgi:hypothetical protein
LSYTAQPVSVTGIGTTSGGTQGDTVSFSGIATVTFNPSGILDPDQVPAIAVIDENDGVPTSITNTDWQNFRAKWPDRPFYVLHVAEDQGTTGPWVGLGTPAIGSQTGVFDVIEVNRDNGNAAWQTDWYDLVGLSTLPRGSMVTLWVDNSGSMSPSSVAASIELFEKNCQDGDLTINRKDGEFPGMYGGEAYIYPFIDNIIMPDPVNRGNIVYRWYEWFSNGVVALNDGGRISGAGTTTLTISNIKTPGDDGRKFYLTADYDPTSAVGIGFSTGNAVNEPLTTNIVTLTTRPVIEIVAEPSPTTTIPNTPAFININAQLSDTSYNNDLTYQWHLNGENVDDGTVTQKTVEQIPGTTDVRVTQNVFAHGGSEEFKIPANATDIIIDIAGGAGGDGSASGTFDGGTGGAGMAGVFSVPTFHQERIITLAAGAKGDDGAYPLGGAGGHGAKEANTSATAGATNRKGNGGDGGRGNSYNNNLGAGGAGGGGGSAAWIRPSYEGYDKAVALIVANGGGGGGGATTGDDGGNGQGAGPHEDPLASEWNGINSALYIDFPDNGKEAAGGGGGGGGCGGGTGSTGPAPQSEDGEGGGGGSAGPSSYRVDLITRLTGTYTANPDSNGWAIVKYTTQVTANLPTEVTRTTTISGSKNATLSLSSDKVGVAYTVGCTVSSLTASNSPIDSQVVNYNVLDQTQEAVINFENITTGSSNATLSTVDLRNGEVIINASTSSASDAVFLTSFYAPDRDVDVEVDLYGGSGKDQGWDNGGYGGYSRIRFTMEQNVEYVIAGLTESINTPYLYRKGTLIANVGEGGEGKGSRPRRSYQNGLGVINSRGVDLGTAISNNGVFGASARIKVASNTFNDPTLYPGDTLITGTNGNFDGGRTITCTKGVYYAQNGVSPCQDVGANGFAGFGAQFRLSDGTILSNTATIDRGYKAGYSIIQTGGYNYDNSGGEGGNGAWGGYASGDGSVGGQGGAGYTDGSVTIVDGSGSVIGNAKVVIRVAN